jgi:hypothetical protein
MTLDSCPYLKILISAERRKMNEAPKLLMPLITALPIRENGDDNSMPGCNLASLSVLL